MSTTPAATETRTLTQKLTVALIGNPNTGKSTLFNALTGGKARIGNFPGVTVEKKVGRFQHNGRYVQLVDLPGTYSLAPRSADEMVSVDVLLGRQKDIGQPDAVVCIADASNLERNLYLFSQIRDLEIPVLLVLNMSDIAKSHGIDIDLEALQSQLGVKAVTTVANHRQGIQEVREAILEVATGSKPQAEKLFPASFDQEVEKLGDWLNTKGHSDVPFYLRKRMLLDVHGEAEHRAAHQKAQDLGDYLAQARERLKEAGCKIPLVETKVRYDWIRNKLQHVVTRSTPIKQATVSDKIDQFLTHKVIGLIFFCLLMLLIFRVITTGADPIMGAVEDGQTWVSDQVQAAMPPGMLRSLLIDGLIAGVGSVVVFLPQIVLLFLFIAIMEDCGYMARAAFLMDKLMTRVGLSGKSFLPLMSSFACAIPGVMATRVIENRRDRMVTMLVAPLMSCSARLPVYVIMVTAFVPAVSYLGGLIGLRELVIFMMYSVGALIAIPIAWILKKTFFKGETPPFVMELPPYKWPSPRVVVQRVSESAQAFLVRAGTLIFAVTVLIWAAGYFPEDHTEQLQVQTLSEELTGTLEELEAEAAGFDEDQIPAALAGQIEHVSFQLEGLGKLQNEIDAKLIRNSYLGRAGELVEPVFKPLGWDWRISVGALASFPAREVIIATLGTIFSLGGDVSEKDVGLISTLQSATWPNGAPLFTLPVAFSVMVFFALCAQCGATLMVIKRETNTWRWPIFTFVYMTALAYVAAFLVYQVGTAIMS